jgi:hypothetical protein
MSKTTVASTGIDLSDTFAFTGTVTGTPQDLVRLTTTNYSSAVSEFDFEDFFTDTYTNYLFVGRGITSANNCNHRMQFKNGSTAITDNSHDWAVGMGTRSRSDTDEENRAQDSTYLQYVDQAHGNTCSFHGWFDTTYRSTSNFVTFNGHSSNWSSDGVRQRNFSGFYHGSTNITGFKIYLSSGNYSAGRFTLYGVKHA